MRCGGYSLIEVLVAMFVLAAGVLGAVGTQSVALRMRHDSDLMTAGLRAASTLAERITANPAAADHYLFEFDSATGNLPPASGQCFAGAACDPAQLAASDRYELSHSLASSFPGGRLKVCRDAQPWDGSRQLLRWECAESVGAPLVIKIGWRERRSMPDRSEPDAPRVALPVPEPKS